jgi:hypothetical protein
VKITPLTPAAAAACRDAIVTRTWAAAAAGRCPVPRPATAGPTQTGSAPARAEPADGPAFAALSALVLAD